LSYAALAGILVIGICVQNIFRGRLPEIVNSPLSASLGAFIATITITAWNFGELRFGGIVAGLVMVPLTSAFMVGALAFPLLSFAKPLANAVDYLLKFVYGILEETASLAAIVPALRTGSRTVVLVVNIALVAAILLYSRYDSVMKNKFFCTLTHSGP
jgi:competence protein ComEC